MKSAIQIFVAGVFVFAIIFSLSCTKRLADKVGKNEPVVLKFSLEIDKEICQQNKYKRTPQFAIWLEGPGDEGIRTVCVTHKTGKGQWGNPTTTRPVSLPVWTSRWNRETGTSGFPTAENPASDAVTCATPDAEFTRSVEVPFGSEWEYFVEVNVSGDHNEHFPQTTKDGKSDPHSNGQPSIIYKGKIAALPGEKSIPILTGRTHQFGDDGEIITDIQGITTAQKLLCQLEVACTGSGTE